MITRDDFVDQLQDAVPESNNLVAEHLADHEELLLHLLMSDLLRLTIGSFSEGRTGVTDRLLEFVDRCLRDGDDYVVNGVGVSFVEHFGVPQDESEALLSRWPPGLRAELGR